MTNPTSSDINDDLGEAYDDIDGTTTTVVTRLITKAKATIKEITGTTTGYDTPIRELANAYCCQQILGSRSYQNVGVEGLNIGQKEILNMRDNFILYAEKALRVKGYTLTGKHIRFEVVNI